MLIWWYCQICDMPRQTFSGNRKRGIFTYFNNIALLSSIVYNSYNDIHVPRETLWYCVTTLFTPSPILFYLQKCLKHNPAGRHQAKGTNNTTTYKATTVLEVTLVATSPLQALLCEPGPLCSISWSKVLEPSTGHDKATHTVSCKSPVWSADITNRRLLMEQCT